MLIRTAHARDFFSWECWGTFFGYILFAGSIPPIPMFEASSEPGNQAFSKKLHLTFHELYSNCLSKTKILPLCIIYYVIIHLKCPR